METAMTLTSLLLSDGQIFEDRKEESMSKSRAISDALRWAVFTPTALGLLGHFRIEEKGENAGLFNIKTHGLDPLMASILAYAASKGIAEHDTLKCIFLLRMKRFISAEMESALAEAYESLMDHLLTHYGRSGNSNGWVCPSLLDRHTHVQIRDALETVERFQNYIYADGVREPSGNAITLNPGLPLKTL
jgi:signal-transduction protein with cAMP-binding, CBS, and nucleotidyltransferase domain